MTDDNETEEAEDDTTEDTVPPWLERQLTRDDLATMTPAQISAAKAEGQLHTLMGGDPRDLEIVYRSQTLGQTITATEAARLAQLGHHELIVKANKEGRYIKENS
ncbi:hypothetical protein [Microbacterium sp. NPDC055357]